MRKLIAGAFVALLIGLGLVWTHPTRAWLVQAPASAPSYTGPGDIVTFTGWWGLRAYNNTQANAGATTTAVADLTGNSTVTSCTLYLLGNGTGGVDLTTSGIGGVGHQCAGGATTFCTSTNSFCDVIKLYCLPSGCTEHLINNSSSVKLVFNCINTSLPCLQTLGSGGNDHLDVTITSVNQPYSASIVTERTGSFTTFQDAIGFGLTSQLGFLNTANHALVYAGTVVSTISMTDSAFHAMNALFSGASSSALIDGTSTGTISIGTTATGTTIKIFSGGNPCLNCNVTEAGWASSDISANFSSLHSNQSGYYGTP